MRTAQELRDIQSEISGANKSVEEILKNAEEFARENPLTRSYRFPGVLNSYEKELIDQFGYNIDQQILNEEPMTIISW